MVIQGRGVAQLGSAPALGAGGRWFESSRPDQFSRGVSMLEQSRIWVLWTVVILMSGACNSSTQTTTVDQTPNAQPNPYQVVDHSLKLPDGQELGWIMGVDIDLNGSDMWIFHTCGGGLQGCVGSTAVEPIAKFDTSGELVTSFGAGMFAHPHGLYVDHEGNIWALDGFGGSSSEQAEQGHQVFKFSPKGELLLTLGTAGVKGNGPDTFYTPSDVLVAPNGDIFVADGHGGDMNDRIVKFDKEGNFIKAWGTKGSEPGQFNNTHSLAMDSEGRLFVGDRANLRIQIFDQNGQFLDEWYQFGAPSEVFIDEDDVIYVADSISDEQTNPDFLKGIRIGNAEDGTLTSFIPDPDPSTLQELVVTDSSGNVWGGHLSGRMVKRFVRD